MYAPLNLLDHCRRAIGEWQDLDIIQSRLLHAEKDVLIKDIKVDGSKDLNLKMTLELSPPGQDLSYPLDLSHLPQEKIDSWKCTHVTGYEAYFCDSPKTATPQQGKVNCRLRTKVSYTSEIQNWATFVDTTIQQERLAKQLDTFTKDEKESMYWAFRFRHRSCSIIPGILQSLEKISFEGIDSVILPTGEKVAISAVKLRVLEVAPEHLYWFQLDRYYEDGGSVMGDKDIPSVGRCPSPDGVKMGVRRFDPVEGIVKTHHVLEIPLSNGKTYIISPTSMEFNHRGPKGTLIAHGEWDNYVKEFPGKVLGTVSSTLYGDFKDVWEETYFLGNGPHRFIENLAKNIARYGERSTCNYCGRIEGKHEIKPKKEFRYIFVSLSLRKCTRCNNVVYCSEGCQRNDWKNHKSECKQMQMEVFNFMDFVSNMRCFRQSRSHSERLDMPG